MLRGAMHFRKLQMFHFVQFHREEQKLLFQAIAASLCGAAIPALIFYFLI